MVRRSRNLTFSLVISCQNAGERLHGFQRERWFKIASSCFGEIPGCFEVCTPLSVLTLTQWREPWLQLFIHVVGEKVSPMHRPAPLPPLFFPCSKATSSLSTELVSYHIIKGHPNASCLSGLPALVFHVVVFAITPRPRCLCYNRVTVRGSHPMHLLQFSHSIDSLAEIYVFSARPPAAALAASLTRGSWWQQSEGTDAQWFPPMHLHLQKPYQCRHHGY